MLISWFYIRALHCFPAPRVGFAGQLYCTGWDAAFQAVSEVYVFRNLCLASALTLILFSTPVWAVENPSRPKPNRPKLTKLDAAVYLATEFDAATTYHLLQECGSGCAEANPMARPFARNPGLFVVMGASAYSVNYFARRLEDRGHRRWATAFRILVIGMHVGAGAHALALEQR